MPLTRHVEVPVPKEVWEALIESGFCPMTNTSGKPSCWSWWAGPYEVSFVHEGTTGERHRGGDIHVHVNIDQGIIGDAVKRALIKGAMDFTEELAKI